tara:strand:+ start:2057 stop:3295 length:1239 start_codon:yes stop_codon:yes gene_type:complete
MESYEYVESGVVFGLLEPENLKSFKYVSKDFAKHSDAYLFLTGYIDDYGKSPEAELLLENYPTLDSSAKTLDFVYATKKFADQVLFRKIVSVFQDNKETLMKNPKVAFGKIQGRLNDLEVVYDEDVTHYDNGESSTRLTDWYERKKLREAGNGVMGIPTPFASLNNQGVGWLPGDLISVFARPEIGKTWLCVEAAAIAALKGFKTLLISTEMPTNSISLRMDVVLGNKLGYNFSHRALRHGDDIEEEAYKKFLNEQNDKNLLICDHIAGESHITVESIAGLIRKHTPEFVVIDGAYLISNGQGNKALWEQSHSLFYAIKNLCLAQNVAIFVSTQANRDAGDVYEPPKAHSVAFGDALLRASDMTLSLCLVEDQPKQRLLQFQKSRDSEVFMPNVLLEWDVNKGKIAEFDTDF